LDGQVKMIFEWMKSVLIYAKSGFEMAKHDNEVLQNQNHQLRDEFTNAKKRNEEMEKKLEVMSDFDQDADEVLKGYQIIVCVEMALYQQ
jgi:hypothetical protein